MAFFSILRVNWRAFEAWLRCYRWSAGLEWSRKPGLDIMAAAAGERRRSQNRYRKL